MKKTLLYAVLSLSTILVKGQDIEWSLNVAPGISYRIPQSSSLNTQAASIQFGEKAMYVFDFGVDIRKSLTPRVRFGTGVLYSQKGFSNNNVAAAYSGLTLNRRYLVDFIQNYIEIPFFLSYDLIQSDQLRFYALAGVNNSLLVNDKNSVTVTKGEASEEIVKRLEEPYLQNKVLHNFGTLAGLGVTTTVDSKTSLGVELIGKLIASPLYDQVSNTRRHLYSLNMNFRFIRKLANQ